MGQSRAQRLMFWLPHAITSIACVLSWAQTYICHALIAVVDLLQEIEQQDAQFDPMRRFHLEESVRGRALGDGPTMGVVLVRPTHAEFRDVPAAELGNRSLTDHGERFRAAADYAARNGFLGAFPTMFHADYDGTTVLGLILLRQGAGEWRDVLLRMDPT